MPNPIDGLNAAMATCTVPSGNVLGPVSSSGTHPTGGQVYIQVKPECSTTDKTGAFSFPSACVEQMTAMFACSQMPGHTGAETDNDLSALEPGGNCWITNIVHEVWAYAYQFPSFDECLQTCPQLIFEVFRTSGLDSEQFDFLFPKYLDN